MTRKAEPQPVERTVILPDGNETSAPWSPTCGACRSPWIVEIDRGLATGLSFASIRADMRGRSPACPNDQILRAHIAHLPEDQREMRRQLEDAQRSLVGVSEAVRELISRGYRQLAEGSMEITTADWVRALALQEKIVAHEQRTASAEAWQAAFLAFFEIARRHMPADHWRAFQAECQLSPEILAVSATMAAQPALRSAS